MTVEEKMGSTSARIYLQVAARAGTFGFTLYCWIVCVATSMSLGSEDNESLQPEWPLSHP